MRAIRLILAFALLLILADLAAAATLHGKIYDIELNELDNVIVEVDSEPKQRYVSKDGGYSFELNPGDYTVTANYSADEWRTYTAVEEISITQDGDYVFDLFLFPGFDTEDGDMLTETDLLDVPETVIDENGKVSGLTIAIIVVIVILALLVIYYLVGRAKEKEEKEELEEAEKVEERARTALKEELEDAGLRNHELHKKQGKKTKHEALDDADLNKVIEIIKREGGRTTQKELRKHIPLSEAKISLMISELEHKKIIQKVKKGRGNILILKRQ
ncbi:hypothetical protein KY359_02760 [Candidatus Woesearchaeota archaeon]|nr:hypothetical protein [Candidatus Woesearchaeota archaeon]